MKISIVAAVLSLAFGSAAFAQTPPNAPPSPPSAPEQTSTDMGPGLTAPPMPRGGHERPAPKPAKTGFDIRMGEDNRLKVECGDQPLAECIEAAQPLIDRMMPARQ